MTRQLSLFDRLGTPVAPAATPAATPTPTPTPEAESTTTTTTTTTTTRGGSARAEASAAFAALLAAPTEVEVVSPPPAPALGSDLEVRLAARVLDGDLVLRAGAGTGKTHTLVDVVAHLVAGATRLGRRVPPSRILMLTFSEKAAAEMRQRVRDRFLALADGIDDGGGLLGEGGPTGSEWSQAAAAVATAPISTFHGFAAGLLRRHSAAAGIDPAFALLDDDEAATLRRRSIEEAALGTLDASDVQALVRELDYARGLESRGKALVEHIDEVLERLAEEGADPQVLAGRGDDPVRAAADFERARGEYTGALGELIETLTPVPGRQVSAGIHTLRERLGILGPAAREALDSATVNDDPFTLGTSLGGWASPPLAEIASATNRNLGTTARNEARKRLDAAAETLREAHAAHRAVPLAASFVALTGRAAAAYQAAKRTLGALDFADLIRLARDLLRDDDAARADEQLRFDAVLVDELQDTNDAQDELVRLVRPPGAPLLCVGDPKQSIYEFRGADVAVFERVAARVAAAGGASRALTESRRARAPLCEVVNRLFARALRGGDHQFEIAFDPQADALVAHRGACGDEHAVELLTGEDSDALRVVRRLRGIRDQGRAIVWDKGAEAPRPARWGDFAVLLRRFTHLDDYLAALRNAGVPHYVVNGRGFYESQEVRDLAHALALLDDPQDALALLGVLRSPLVGLSDAALVALADLDDRSGSAEPGRRPLGRLSLLPLLRADLTVPALLTPDESARLTRFLALYRRLRRHADRAGAAGALRALVEETDLAAVLATTYYGEQRVANLTQLLSLAAAHDENRRGDRRAFVRRLRALAQRERSLAAPAQILGERDDVVRVMTIHQAKGLEFPIVFVPDCGAGEQNAGGGLVYDREAGLGFRLRMVDGERVPTPRARAAVELRKARVKAESKRLFYVATTRARDLLVLSGEISRSDTWRHEIDALLEQDPIARALVTVIPDGARPAGTTTTATTTTTTSTSTSGPANANANVHVNDPAPVRRFLIRLDRPATPAGRLIAPVTELADLDACPRRYHLRHEIGLEDHPDPAPPRPARGLLLAPDDPEVADLDPQERGTIAHRLLERLDFADWRKRKLAALDDLLAAAGFAAPLSQEVTGVRDQVAAFLATPFGSALAERSDGDVRREVPFAFAIGGTGGAPRLLLKGQIDLVIAGAGASHSITVLDYKLARSADSPDYRFQLLSYAAAARALWGQRPRAGLVFLGDRDPTPRIEEVTDGELDRFVARLEGLAATLADARRAAEWPGRELRTCKELGCGYVKRCHPGRQLNT